MNVEMSTDRGDGTDTRGTSGTAAPTTSTTDRLELTMEEIRAVTAYAVACAEPTLSLFEKACPQDPLPAEALAAARAFGGT